MSKKRDNSDLGTGIPLRAPALSQDNLAIQKADQRALAT